MKHIKTFESKQIDKDFLLKKIKNIENFKPALEFDKKYGTTLSQEYKYPFDLTCDDVYNIIDYDDNFYDRYHKLSKPYSTVIDNLTNDYFPYVDFNKIRFHEKAYILTGMASCFNYDDIIWFSIDEMYAYKNIEVNKEKAKFPVEIQRDIQWVMSPKTLETMKSQLKELGYI